MGFLTIPNEPSSMIWLHCIVSAEDGRNTYVFHSFSLSYLIPMLGFVGLAVGVQEAQGRWQRGAVVHELEPVRRIV
jgi:hypothetical protein